MGAIWHLFKKCISKVWLKNMETEKEPYVYSTSILHSSLKNL